MKKAILVSLVLHILFVIGFFLREKALERDRAREPIMTLDRPALSTRVLTQSEFDRVVETALKQKMNATPEDVARYKGEQTQRVAKETRAVGFGSATGERRSGGDSSKEKSKALIKQKALWNLPMEGEVLERLDRDTKIGLSKGNMDALDATISIGSDTLLNTDEYIYAGFFNRVKREVAPRWEPVMQDFLRKTQTLSDGVFTTRWAFFVDAKGYVQDMQILDSSGSRSLDDIAARSLREVGRFPNPPQSLRSAGGLFRVELGFVVQYTKKGFSADYVPDPRFRRK